MLYKGIGEIIYDWREILFSGVEALLTRILNFLLFANQQL